MGGAKCRLLWTLLPISQLIHRYVPRHLRYVVHKTYQDIQIIGRFISDLNEDNVSDEDVQKLDYPDHQDRKIRQGGNENTGILGWIGRKNILGRMFTIIIFTQYTVCYI